MKSIRSISTVSLPLLKNCVSTLNFSHWLPRRHSLRGRPPYERIKLFLALLLKIREHFPSDTMLVQKLEENQTYREFCGFSKTTIPSHDVISGFTRELTPRRLQTIITKLDKKLTSLGAFDRDELAIDATDILSNGRNIHNLDPEAGWGHKVGGERFHGYWAVFVTGTESEMLRAVRVTPADVHQSMTAQKLFDDLEHRGLCGATLLSADSAYDDRKSYHRCINLDIVPLIAYNPRNSKIQTFAQLKPSNWRKRCLGPEGIELYQQYYFKRSSVERYNSTFKDILAGRVVPVRGLIKVTRHLLLVSILSQLYGIINHTIKSQQQLIIRSTLDDYFHQSWTGTDASNQRIVSAVRATGV
jgi:transposase